MAYRSETNFERRRRRNRAKLVRINKTNLPRLSVHRTGKQIYAQIIDDVKGITLASASSIEKDVDVKSGANITAASKIGKLIAERAKKAGVSKVVFDRGGNIYHGRVKALADAARTAGLEV